MQCFDALACLFFCSCQAYLGRKAGQDTWHAPVRDKFNIQIVLTALIFPHIPVGLRLILKKQYAVRAEHKFICKNVKKRSQKRSKKMLQLERKTEMKGWILCLSRVVFRFSCGQSVAFMSPKQCFCMFKTALLPCHSYAFSG